MGGAEAVAAAVVAEAGEVSAEAEAAAVEDEGRHVVVAVAVVAPEAASGVTITGLESLCFLQFPLDLCRGSDNYI